MLENCKAFGQLLAEAKAERAGQVEPIAQIENLPVQNQISRAVPIQGFYLNRSIKPVKDLFDYLATLRLEIGHDTPKFLDKFNDFRIQAFNQPKGLTQNLFNKFLPGAPDYTGKQQYVLIGTRHKGIPGQEYEEVIGSLPIDREGYGQSRALYDYLQQQHGFGQTDFEAPVNKSVLINLVSFTYGPAYHKAQPPQLNTQRGNEFSLQELKERYGAHYPYLFSQVYCITDTRNGRFNRNHRGEDIGNRLVGKSVIFYNKFPTKERTVDELLEKGSQNDQLGYLVLDEGVAYKNADEMLDALKATEGDDDYHAGRLLLPDYVLDRLFNAIYSDRQLNTDVYNSEFASLLNQVIRENRNTKGEVELEIKATKVNRALFVEQLENLKNNDVHWNMLNRIIQDKTIFKHGVYISPVLVQSNQFKHDSIAKVHQTPQNEKFLYQRLKLTNLADNVVSVPNFEMEFSDHPQQRQKQFQALFNLDQPAFSTEPEASGNQLATDQFAGAAFSGPIQIGSAPQTDTRKGSKVEPSMAQLLRPFSEQYGISARDLKEFVANEFNPIVMQQNSDNFTQHLQDYLDQNGVC